MIERLIRWALKNELESIKEQLRRLNENSKRISDKVYENSLKIKNNSEMSFMVAQNNTTFFSEDVDLKLVVRSILNHLEAQGAVIKVTPRSFPIIEITKKGRK